MHGNKSSNRRHGSSTLVNLSAFRPLETGAMDIEMGTIKPKGTSSLPIQQQPTQSSTSCPSNSRYSNDK